MNGCGIHGIGLGVSSKCGPTSPSPSSSSSWHSALPASTSAVEEEILGRWGPRADKPMRCRTRVMAYKGEKAGQNEQEAV